MFKIKALHTETVSLRAGTDTIRDFFCDVVNYIEFMPHIENIRTDNRGITHWHLSANVPFVGNFSERFPIVRTEQSEERVEWSPVRDEEFNLMKFAADFLPESATSTIVKISQNIELRRNSPTDLHLLAGFAGESLISKEMTKRVVVMVKSFLEKARIRLEKV
ncbi:MAG: hypothetical protein HKN33_04810 [Pyrinomonadaceae bacterium]|nr:hypothetical protein [Pyrinomonadaceae bacterium]